MSRMFAITARLVPASDEGSLDRSITVQAESLEQAIVDGFGMFQAMGMSLAAFSAAEVE